MSGNIKVVSSSKKSEIEAIRKKTTGVERALHSLETSWKIPTNMKDINKWQKAIEEKMNYTIKTLSEVNNTVWKWFADMIDLA